MSHQILLIEDHQQTANYIIKALGEEGMAVNHTLNGRDGLFLAAEGDYDAIILDRVLPQMDGMAVLSALRVADIHTPVLMLSALGTVDDRVAGLTAGSDDYLVKPFAFAELLARLRRLLRREGDMHSARHLVCGDLEINPVTRKARRGGRILDLKPREYRLIEYLIRHKDQVVTRTMLLEGVWGYHFDSDTNVIDVHISRLRRKIDDGHGSTLIHTVRGSGYRLGVED